MGEGGREGGVREGGRGREGGGREGGRKGEGNENTPHSVNIKPNCPTSPCHTKWRPSGVNEPVFIRAIRREQLT